MGIEPGGHRLVVIAKRASDAELPDLERIIDAAGTRAAYGRDTHSAGHLLRDAGIDAGFFRLDKWIALARTPGPANPGYGFANWYLNPGRKDLPSAPADSVTFRGNGTNIIYIDWDNDLVVVVRWIEGNALDPFLGAILAAITPPGRN